MVTAEALVDTIELVISKTGHRVVKVDKAGYDAAKKDGSLPWFLDVYVSGTETDVSVTEPGGKPYNPYWMPE